MRKIASMLFVVGVCVVATVAYAKAGKEVVMTAEEMKWTEIPESNGVKTAAVHGDMMKGAHEAFIKMPAGANHPLHTHSSDMKLVVVSGTFKYAPEGSDLKNYGPGSYIMVKGKAKHLSGCDAGADCLVFQTSTGKFDMKPVEMKKAEK
jgi:quercetin dioxygenase-like cupin family protein